MEKEIINRKQSRKTSKNSRGYIMIYVIAGCVLISLIGSMIVNLAGLESKTCRYSTRLSQAQEAARAGVEWGLEEIFASLRNEADRQELPTVLLTPGPHSILTDESTPIGFILEFPGAVLASSDQGSCTYTMYCTGYDHTCRRTLRAQCRYRFASIYEPRADGGLGLKCRVFTDRGRIIDLKISQ